MNKKGVGLKGKYHIRDKTLFTKRKCLKCDKIFESEGIGNRICAPCQLTNNKHG